jgi:hypothetical protein
MKIFSKNEANQFRVIVEQLELCCNLLKDDTLTKARVAIILLDNISEIILHRKCQKLFDEDDFVKWITPQQFSTSKKRKINKYYPEKIDVIEQSQIVSSETLKVLEICHKYRNYIYHQKDYQGRIPTIDYSKLQNI